MNGRVLRSTQIHDNGDRTISVYVEYNGRWYFADRAEPIAAGDGTEDAE